MAEHPQKMAARAEKTKATGKTPGGKPPAPPLEGARPSDQINLTDEESRIMPVAGGGFGQCYNAQGTTARCLSDTTPRLEGQANPVVAVFKLVRGHQLLMEMLRR
ncbi:MAG: hypothetical protein ACI92A_002343, partial [Candidatus Paceibacteria bacterium]